MVATAFPLLSFASDSTSVQPQARQIRTKEITSEDSPSWTVREAKGKGLSYESSGNTPRHTKKGPLALSDRQLG